MSSEKKYNPGLSLRLQPITPVTTIACVADVLRTGKGERRAREEREDRMHEDCRGPFYLPCSFWLSSLSTAATQQQILLKIENITNYITFPPQIAYKLIKVGRSEDIITSTAEYA